MKFEPKESLDLCFLQQKAVEAVKERILEAEKDSVCYRTRDIQAAHIAAHMNIEKTLEALKPILEYRIETAKAILSFADEESIKIAVEAHNHADGLIKKLLGILI